MLTGSGVAELEWLEHLPSNRLAATKKLRSLLADEADAVERHFMFLELEKLLYRIRDEDEPALADFERTCIEHDSEMDEVVELLSRKKLSK